MKFSRRAFGPALAIPPALIVPGLLYLVPQTVWPAAIAYHLYCLLVPLACGHKLHETGNPRNWLPFTIVVSVLVLLAGEAIARFGDVELLLPQGWQALPARLQPFALYAIYSLLVNPFAEEFFWRSFLLPRTGVLLQGVLFWLFHALGSMVFTGPVHAIFFTLAVLAAGWIWGWMRVRFGSFWPCVITHLAADAAILRAFAQVM